MTVNERKYSEHDLRTAERIGGVEAILRDHVIPALERIEANCTANRCRVAPAVIAPSAPQQETVASSSAWFWGKVAGAVVALLSTITAVGVALVQKTPEILAAVSAFFNPPKHP